MSAAANPSAATCAGDRQAQAAECLLRMVGQINTSPLSFAQQRLWFLDQLEPNNPRYNMQSVFRLVGTLDIAALGTALNMIAARHEALRTRFVSEDGVPMQIVDEEVTIELAIKDLATFSEAEIDGLAERLVAEEVQRPFQLNADRLFRATLVKCRPGEHLLMVSMHHLISDEWSFKVFHRELESLYTGLVRGEPAGLPELPIQYSDYALWQREWLQGEVLEKQIAFWKEQLSGNPPGVELPTDHPRRSTPSPRGAKVWRGLGRDLSDAIKQLSQREEVTLFMTLLAAFNALLYRYTRQQDIIVGSPIAGRTRVETENLIGFFVNTLPLRSRLSEGLSFQGLLVQVREMTLGALSHQDLPFDKLVEAVQPERSINNTPFVNVMFLVEHDLPQAPQWPGLQIEFVDAGVGPAKFDLTLAIHEFDGELFTTVQYNRELFEADTMDRFLGHYSTLLAGAVAQPAQQLSQLPLLSAVERHQLLVEWNNTQTAYPRDASVPGLFEEQVRESPDSIAVSFGKAHLTYRELNERSNQLARYLAGRGIRPGMLVGICAERSLELIVGLLGILKAGAAYASLDPALPDERLGEMLEDLQTPVLLLTHSRLLKPFGRGSPDRVCLDLDWSAIRDESVDNPAIPINAAQLAYVSFTSGSTGRPKGVCVPHRAVIRLVRNTNYAHFSRADVFLQLAPLSFDASTFEVWGPLLNGGRLAVFPPHIPTLSELTEVIQKEQVTTAWFTSGLFHQLVDEAPEALEAVHQILAGGDVLSPPHIVKALSFLGTSTLINGYGPTENTTFTTCYRLPGSIDAARSIPIGRPISNTTCYVLDDRLQLVPLGVPGELYAGGAGLATGYLNAPELTADKFVAHPFVPGERLYKTGDQVRWLPDGNLEFIGRINDQVKIRGFRVEPGEIESKLLEHPQVRQCVVTARPDGGGAKQLVAYVVAVDGAKLAVEQLRTFVRQHLPDYMVPTFWVSMADLPLSPNGKVDRRALPVPETRTAIEGEASEPRDDTERQLKEIWEEILGLSRVGIHEQFFALGGHSLLAVRLLARVEKRFARQLRVAVLFQNPTIAEFAAVLRGGDHHHQNTDSSLVKIQPHGSKPPLLLVHGAGGGMFWGYANLARHLGDDQPVCAFKSRGLEGRKELDTIEELAEAYLADLRAFQPCGPYSLGGYCFGGVVAFEMARRLQQQGETIHFLGLINSSAPNTRYYEFRWTPPIIFKFLKNIFLRSFYSYRAHPERFHRFLGWKARSLAKRLGGAGSAARASFSQEAVAPEDWIDMSQYSEDERRVWHQHLRALVRYKPEPYPGRVCLFRSPVHPVRCSFDADYGWGELAAGGVLQKIIPGAHETIMEEPGVRILASAIESSLTAGPPA
jgi:amino acid adenylation domain-containing protein